MRKLRLRAKVRLNILPCTSSAFLACSLSLDFSSPTLGPMHNFFQQAKMRRRHCKVRCGRPIIGCPSGNVPASDPPEQAESTTYIYSNLGSNISFKREGPGGAIHSREGSAKWGAADGRYHSREGDRGERFIQEMRGSDCNSEKQKLRNSEIT